MKFTALFGIASKAGKFLGSIKTTALIVIVAFILGSGLGFWVKHKLALADSAEDAQRALTAQQEAVRRAIDEAERLRALDFEILSQATAREVEIREIEVKVPHEVIKYVPRPEDDIACRLPVGGVRLLNVARRGEGELPDAAAVPDEEERAPSALTREAELAAHADCGIRYRRLASEHDALIDWLHERDVSLDNH